MADLTKSAQHIVEQLVGVTGGTYDDVVVKGFLKFTGATANPADITQLDNASSLVSAAFTATGVAVGDIVLGYGVVSGLASGQHPVTAYVSATDTITVLFGNIENTAVTTTATTMNFIVADVT